ncbi:cytochrome C oxidase subunit IV family protein [bacterium SCSIO 12741]|nr:cytochrome C oxidase subunit IV family protein [bacterium SCSIO 12741]
MKRDDIIEYSLGATHSEEEGKKIRKKIWFVTAILSIVTAAEVLLGVFANAWGVPSIALKLIFIGLTIVKAGYIVMVFMHLGDERKMFKYFILLPYGVFILYLLFLLFTEATSVASSVMSTLY